MDRKNATSFKLNPDLLQNSEIFLVTEYNINTIQECLSVEIQPPAWFDLDLGPMTLVLKLDLDMVLIYHCAKKKVSIPSASKVTARTRTQTDRHRQTDAQTRQKHYLSAYAGGN